MKRVLAFVFAGVRDDGLSVLTHSRSVAAVPIAGKYRLVDFTLSNCVNSELYRVSILAQHSPHSLIRHVGRGEPWDLNRRDGGVQILQPYERQEGRRWYQGTADALRQNLDVVENAGSEEVFVLSSDLIYKMDYTWMMQFHRDTGAAATLAVGRPSGWNPRAYGVVDVGEDSRVESFTLEPEENDPRDAFLGIYIFRTDYLRDLLAGDDVNLFLDCLIPRLGIDPVHAYRFEGEWSRISNLDAYLAAHRRLLADPPTPDMHDPAWRIYTRSEERAPAAVDGASDVSDSLIANGSVIFGEVKRSVLSAGVYVAPGAVVRDSVVLNDVSIGPGSVVENAILDKNSQVGARGRVGRAGDAIAAVGEWGVVPDDGVIEAGEAIPPREPSVEEWMQVPGGGGQS